MEIQNTKIPYAIELEGVVLGAILLVPEAFDTVKEILVPESFWKDAHQIIYRAMMSLSSRKDPIDIITVTQELIKTGHLDIVGGAYYISTLTNRVASDANTEFHARIIAQKYIQREIAKIAANAQAKAYDEGIDVLDTLSDLKFQLDKLESGFSLNKKSKSTREIVSNTLEAIKDAKKNKGILGPSTGLSDLDSILRGLRRTNIYVIAGRPAMGKTSAVLCIAKSLCINQNIPVAVFSLEMSSEQLMHRLLSDLSEIDNNHLASGELKQFEEDQLYHAQQKVTNNFHLDDTASITIQYFESKMRKLVQEGVQYAIIDYLQLMSLTEKDAKGKTEEQKLAFITKSLKRIAKDLNIGIIELSQLSRKCEERNPPRPMLSDLRDSGAIEQDADVVIFLYRPEYYNIEFTSSGKSSKGKAELIVAKHRSGPIDSAVVRFKGELTRFENIEEKTESFDTNQQPVIF